MPLTARPYRPPNPTLVSTPTTPPLPNHATLVHIELSQHDIHVTLPPSGTTPMSTWTLQTRHGCPSSLHLHFCPPIFQSKNPNTTPVSNFLIASTVVPLMSQHFPTQVLLAALYSSFHPHYPLKNPKVPLQAPLLNTSRTVTHVTTPDARFPIPHTRLPLSTFTPNHYSLSLITHPNRKRAQS